MTISIANHLAPFSHIPGTQCLVPGTDLTVQVYPTRLLIKEEVIEFPLKGPIRNFTVEQNLDHGKVSVYFFANGDYVRYLLIKEENQVRFRLEKGPLFMQEKTFSCRTYPLTKERLSFGVHKKQCIEEMSRRLDLQELLPFWFQLGLSYPTMEQPSVGTLTLLKKLQTTIKKEERNGLSEALTSLYSAAFSSLLHPRLNDTDYQGLAPWTDEKVCTLPLLSNAAHLIRSLFFKRDAHSMQLLPFLPKTFVSGRMITDEVAFEWTKGKLRKVIFIPIQTEEIALILPSEMQSCRLRLSRSDKGRTIQKPFHIPLKVGETLFLDRFEK